jgi:hypothetical protein
MTIAALAFILEANRYKWGSWKKALRLQATLTAFFLHKRLPEAREPLIKSECRQNIIPAHIILFHVKDKMATNPKDKVFGLYGILKDLSFEMPEPDYQKAVEVIYREATVASIKLDRLLNILYYAPSDNRRPGMESWVPDWNDRAWALEDARSPVIGGGFQACRRSNSIWEFSGDETKLIVKGKIIDEVIYRSAVMPSDQAWSEERDAGRGVFKILNSVKKDYEFRMKGLDIFKAWLEVSQWSDYPTGETTKEAFRRTILMDECKDIADRREKILKALQAPNHSPDDGQPHMLDKIVEEVTPIHQTYTSRIARSNVMRNLDQLTKSTDAFRPAQKAGSVTTGYQVLDSVQQTSDSFQTLRTSEAGREHFRNLVDQNAKDLLAYLRGQRDFNQWLGMIQLPKSNSNQRLYITSGGEGAWHHYLMQMNRSKCFYRTAKGYFGTAPDPPCVSVMTGDRVALISGLDHPVLLRPVEGGWKLLTHVYLHGIMHGEAWPGDESELERLVLV